MADHPVPSEATDGGVAKPLALRQLVLIARDLEATVRTLTDVFDINVSHRDPVDYGGLGLENAVMPLGDTFLEVVSPIRDDSPTGRYLQHVASDGGYMVIFQTGDLDAAASRATDAGVRFVYREEFPDQRQWHMHPKDIGGALVALDSPAVPTDWRWAGPDWKQQVRTSRVLGIRGIQLSSPDPQGLADRWAEVLAIDVGRASDDALVAPIANATTLRFVQSEPDLPARMRGIRLACSDIPAILTAAEDRNLPVAKNQFRLGDVTFSLGDGEHDLEGDDQQEPRQ